MNLNPPRNHPISANPTQAVFPQDIEILTRVLVGTWAITIDQSPMVFLMHIHASGKMVMDWTMDYQSWCREENIDVDVIDIQSEWDFKVVPVWTANSCGIPAGSTAEYHFVFEKPSPLTFRVPDGKLVGGLPMTGSAQKCVDHWDEKNGCGFTPGFGRLTLKQNTPSTASSVNFIYQNVFQKVESDDPEVWELHIQKFEDRDKEDMPPQGSVLFIGSSSITYWTSLKDDMKPLPVLNRGFGGAKIPDVTFYARRMVIPYRPRIIVFYAGDNDMSTGKIHSPDEVLTNFKRFVSLVHGELPDTTIYFISIKPSSTRWKFWPEMNEANLLIHQFAAETEKLEFIDISASMLDSEGKTQKRFPPFGRYPFELQRA